MDTLRMRSRWLARAILGVLVILMLVPVTIVVAVLAGRYHLGDVIVRQLPMIFYVAALWSIRGALNEYARGGSLSDRAGRSIQAVGMSLFLGGLTSVFVVPTILLAIHGHGSFALFDVSAITLGAVGLSLVVIGRLLGDAEAARRELEEFL